MKIINTVLLLLIIGIPSKTIAAPKREFYEIKIYKLLNAAQEKVVNEFLQTAYLPALHRAGIRKVGVFTPIESDTTYVGKRIYVFIPFTSSEQYTTLTDVLEQDKQFQFDGKNYLTASYDNPPYARIESVFLRAFTGMVKMELPKLTTPAHDRIYELRSYEGYTEKTYQNKVKMFNDGDEVGLFKRLEFNAVFYAEVISGSNMPNLMYMTTFNNRAARDEHWKTFSADPQWKKLSAMPEYQHNVSKNNTYLLHPTDYSDILIVVCRYDT